MCDVEHNVWVKDSMCAYENVLCRLGREGGVSVESLDPYTLSKQVGNI